MLPTIFSLPGFTLRSLDVMLVIAWLFIGFVFWRRGKDEHYNLTHLFDGLFIATLMGVITARLGFILFHVYEFGLKPLLWLNFAERPGLMPVFGALGFGGFLYWFSTKHKWDFFELMDFSATALSLGLVVSWLGLFLDGTGFGFPTSMPWGMTFPTVVDKHHPTQLYQAILFFVLFLYLSKVEFKYRTFNWYKGKRRSAQTGFLMSVFLIAYGLVELVISFVTPASSVLWGVRIDWMIDLLVTFSGLYLLYFRSGVRLSVEQLMGSNSKKVK